MGYVGLTLAIVLADVGFEVKGYDKNKKLIKNIKNKKAPFFEKGMQAYLDSQVGNNCNLIDRLENFNSDVYIITVGTPFDKKKNKLFAARDPYGVRPGFIGYSDDGIFLASEAKSLSLLCEKITPFPPGNIWNHEENKFV